MFFWQNSLLLNTLFQTLMVWLPKLVAALAVIIFTKWLSRKVNGITKKVIEQIHLGKLITSFGLDDKIVVEMMSKIGLIVGVIVGWVVWYFGLMLMLMVLNLDQLVTFLMGLMKVFPKLISAGFLLVLGTILADFGESRVKKVLNLVDRSVAILVGKIVSYSVFVSFLLMALAELGIASVFIVSLFIGLVATMSLAIGLSLGLGTKDMVKQLVEEWRSKQKKNRNK